MIKKWFSDTFYHSLRELIVYFHQLYTLGNASDSDSNPLKHNYGSGAIS